MKSQWASGRAAGRSKIWLPLIAIFLWAPASASTSIPCDDNIIDDDQTTVISARTISHERKPADKPAAQPLSSQTNEEIVLESSNEADIVGTLPGVSAERARFYKRQMFRTDI